MPVSTPPPACLAPTLGESGCQPLVVRGGVGTKAGAAGLLVGPWPPRPAAGAAAELALPAYLPTCPSCPTCPTLANTEVLPEGFPRRLAHWARVLSLEHSAVTADQGTGGPTAAPPFLPPWAPEPLPLPWSQGVGSGTHAPCQLLPTHFPLPSQALASAQSQAPPPPEPTPQT